MTRDAPKRSAPLPQDAALTGKGKRTRDGIIVAAADLIHAQGAPVTTLADVRKAAGVSSSQLYHYFTDKQDLVRAVVDHQSTTVIENQRAMQLTSLDAFRRWRRDLVADEAARHGQGGCPLGSLGSDLAETDPVGRDRVAVGFRRWAQVIEQGLDHMHADGRLPADTDARSLATGILAALQGGLLMSQIERSATALDAALGNVIDLLDGLDRRATTERAVTHRPGSRFETS